MTPIRRAATDAERAVIARRGERRNAAKQAGPASQSRDSGTLIVIGAVLVGIGFVMRSEDLIVVREMMFVMGAMLVILGGLGVRASRRRRGELLAAQARLDADRARAVSEHRLDVDRIVTATDDEGAGDEWWLFHLDDGSWLAFEAAQWDDIDVFERAWHRDVRIVLDGSGLVLSVESAGPPVTVENRSLQPPDYVERPDTLYWTPPGDVGSLPIAVTGDPTRPRPS